MNPKSIVEDKGKYFYYPPNGHRYEILYLPCTICKKETWQQKSRYNKNGIVLCSKDCISLYMKNNPKCRKSGKDHPSWKGGKNQKSKAGYTLTWDKKYIHRQVMENYLGRKLKKEEVVHHKDLNKDNNKLENLTLFNGTKEHHEFHWKQTKLMLEWFKKNKPELYIKFINGEFNEAKNEK